MDNAGKLAVFNNNAVLTGQAGQSLNNTFVLNDQPRGTPGKGVIDDVVFQGDYLYIEGLTTTKFGNAGLIEDPDANFTALNQGQFLLPMDFQLRLRRSGWLMFETLNSFPSLQENTMENLSKVTAAALGLSLLLAACGSTNRLATTQNPTQLNSGGFEVQGQPNVKRTRLTLPRPSASVMSPRLSAQARTSPMPEWTGPQLFPSGTTDIATNPSGEVSISHLYQGNNASTTMPPQVVKFSGNGQRLQLGRFPFGTNICYSNGLDHNQVFVTAENPAREAYQLVPLYNVTTGAVTLSAQIYGSGMQVLSNGSDQQFPLPIGNLNDLTDVTSNTEGIATVESDTNYDIREMAYENWGEIGLRQHTVLRSPQSLATHPKGARIASASDGSLYVLASVSIPQFENMEECRPYFTATYSGTSCPVVMGLTKFVNGDVAWQVYWDG